MYVCLKKTKIPKLSEKRNNDNSIAEKADFLSIIILFSSSAKGMSISFPGRYFIPFQNLLQI